MDPGDSSSEAASAPGYTNEDLIITVISRIDDGNGVDIDGLFKYCEENYDIPEDYMKVLEEDLKNLVSQNKLEKVETRYKVIHGTVTQATNRNSSSSEELLEDSEAAAKALAVAENAELEAKEASELGTRKRKRTSGVASAPRYTYDDVLIEAISTINDGKGVDIDGIYEFCEEQYELPQDYRQGLDEDLKNLVSQNKIEKVETHYKIHEETVAQKELREKTEAAAEALAVAENAEREAKEASEYVDTTQKLLEESDLKLQLAQEVADKCAKGEEFVFP